MRYKVLAPVLFLFLLTGASCPEQFTPNTPQERLAAAEISYQAALDQAEALVDVGTLKGDNAATVLSGFKKAKTALSAYRVAVLQGGDTDATLEAFNSALAEAIKEMREKANE